YWGIESAVNGFFDRLAAWWDGDDSEGDSEDARPQDPNSATGPAGFGPENFIANVGQALPYAVNFENDPTATAPAQRVVVTDQLAPRLDWATFQFTQVGFGDNIITVPAANGHFFRTTVPMTYNGQTFDVRIQLGLDLDTGTITVTYQSLNPET